MMLAFPNTQSVHIRNLARVLTELVDRVIEQLDVVEPQYSGYAGE